MISRPRAALAALLTAVLGISIAHNRKLYGPHRWNFVIGKSFLDLALLSFAVMTLPILLLGWSGAFLTDHIVTRTWKNRYWIVTVAVVVGVILTMLGSVCFEAIVLLSILPVNIITHHICRRYQELRLRRQSPATSN